MVWLDSARTGFNNEIGETMAIKGLERIDFRWIGILLVVAATALAAGFFTGMWISG